jgi:hypothetical protein
MRWAAEVELMQRLVKELVALQPDLILSRSLSCCTCSGLELMWWTAPPPGDESP